MQKYCLLVILSYVLIGWTQALSREDALDVDIVTRDERGANEVWRLASQFGIATEPTPMSPKRQSIYEYLVSFFADDVALDDVDTHEGGEQLHRPREYKHDKKGIVIHHTVSSQERIQEQGGVMGHLQQMYKFHTFTRGWGDIGYNFLIDQDGVIYEGRAGGADVIGAHTRRNNNSTVGVSLIGNFQTDYPSEAMMQSLIDLSTALAIHYDIDPLQEIIVHQETQTEPYVDHVHTSALLGHRDAGVTSCPGDHVYELLPQVRVDVARHMLADTLGLAVDMIHTHNPVQRVYGRKTSTQQLSLTSTGTTLTTDVSCQWIDSDLPVPLDVVSCVMTGDRLDVDIRIDGDFVPGPYPLLVADDDHQEIRYIDVVWDTALADMLRHRRQSLQSTLPTDPAPMQKITDYITIDKIHERADDMIRVLLHDASLGPTAQQISCEHRCMVEVGAARTQRDGVGSGSMFYGTNTGLVVSEFEGVLGISVDGESVFGADVSIYDAGSGWVSLDMYERTSYAGVPWNRFGGTITIRKDRLRDINTGIWKNEYVYINTLPFRKYLYGIAEAAVDDPIEKQKVLALLTKSYAMFYLQSDNPHSSLAADVGYDAIDDPRAFQKYVGVGRLDVYPAWRTVVDEMQEVWVMYDDYLPLLPYFNCSAGFTWGGQEKRGWTDTPRLKSVLDWSVSSCETFAGHGVGLSGEGATYMADYGIKYTDILQYYYPGISIIQ